MKRGGHRGRNKAVKETELALQSLFLHLRSGEDQGWAQEGSVESLAIVLSSKHFPT